MTDVPTDHRARNDATRDRIAERLEQARAIGDVGEGRRENARVGHLPAAPMHSPEPARSLDPVLTPTDLEWIRLLDPQHLDEADAAALRGMRNRAGRDDERRLLNRVLTVDDARQAEAARRRAIQQEIQQVDAGLEHPIGFPDPDSRVGRRAVEFKAASRVRDEIADAIRAENARWREDPRRTEDTQVWRVDHWENEGEADHLRRLGAIESPTNRDALTARAQVAVRKEMTDERQAYMTDLAKRKQDLTAQLNNPNANGSS